MVITDRATAIMDLTTTSLQPLTFWIPGMAHLANSQIHSQENQRSPSRYGYRGLKTLLTHFSINLSLVSPYRRLLLFTLACLPVVVLSALILTIALVAPIARRHAGPA